MSLYPTKQTPIPWDEPPHMPAMPQPWTHSTSPVETTPGPEFPQSRHEREILHFSLVPSVASSQHIQETPQLEDLLVDTQDICTMETLFFNQPHHLLQQSPLTLIMDSHTPRGLLPCHHQPPTGNRWGTPFSSLNLSAH